MKRSFQIPPFVGWSFVERTPSRHTGLGSPLAVQRENIFQSKLITVYENSLLFLFFLLYYLSSSTVSQSQYKFSPCALYNTRRPLLREKTYINLKKKIAQCIWKVVTRFLWNDGKENSNLWEKKVELEGFITQLLSLNKSEWICK